MQIHTTFVTNLREGLSRGSPKVNNETKRNENRDDLQNVSRITFNCLFIILLRAVRIINLTFARYSPILEMQNDRILFWLYLFRDHRERVIVASLDKRVKLKYPFAQT